MTLREYVRRRNGVPLGHPSSLQMMLKRSLGASDYAHFWRYWNPIWSYYLSRFVNRPLSGLFPARLAAVVTFAVSGFAHDLAILVISGQLQFACLIWFSQMGVLLVLSQILNITYSSWPFAARAVANLAPTLITAGLTSLVV